MQERKDRECAFSKCIEMEQRYIHQVQSLAEELGETNMKNDVCVRNNERIMFVQINYTHESVYVFLVTHTHRYTHIHKLTHTHTVKEGE